MVFSPDGQQLLTANVINQFMLWDIADGSLIKRWDGKPFDPTDFNYSRAGGHVAYSPNGKFMALGDNGSVQIIDAQSGKTLHTLEVGKVLGLAFSPDGNQIAVGNMDSMAGQQKLADGIQLWDVASGKLVQTLPGKSCIDNNVSFNCTWGLVFTPDGQIIIAGSNGIITLWDLANGHQVQNWFDPKLSNLSSMNLSPDGITIAASGGGVTKLWNMKGHDISPNAFGILPLWSWNDTFDPTGKLVAGVGLYSNEYYAKVWNVADQRLIGSLEVNIDFPSRIVFSPGGDVLAISTSGFVYFYAIQP